MAIVEKTNRKGVDKAIHVLQQRTYANLLGFWADGVEYTMYPRVNKNFKNDSTIPEISLDSKNYKETFYDDKVAVNSFFLVDDQSTYQNDNNQIVQDVSIIFQADLVKLYGDAERVDEVFNSDVLQVFKDVKRFIYSDIERITGFDSVYSDLSLSADLREKIQFSDISNRHILRLDFSIRYDFKCDSPIVPLCVPVTIMENGVLVARQAAGTTYSYSTACIDGNVTVNDSEFGTVASGGTLDVPVQYENGTEVGVNVGGVIEIPNPITCADATVNLNGVFNQTVASGGTADVIVGNSEITVNGAAFDSLAPEEALNVPVQYENGSPIGTITVGVVVVPDPVIANNSASLFKTGANVSYQAQDDGALQFGNGVDFFTLNANNPFGNLNRFTDNLGTQIYANGIVIDWSTWNVGGATVRGYYNTLNAANTLTNQLSNQPYTKASFTGWYVCNYNQLTNIFNLSITRNYMNYAPFNHSVGATNTRVWVSTRESATIGIFYSGASVGVGNHSGSYQALLTREFTLTELGL
jgi:hypothetical protein